MQFDWNWERKSERLLVSGMTILTACDSSYIHYAISLLRSIDYFSPGCSVVVLLVDPQQDDIDNMMTILEKIDNIDVSIVSERNSTISSMSQEQRLAYYASVRFLFAQTLLEDLQGPLICVDADSLVVGRLEGNPALEADADVALWRREKSHRLDHQKVAAGVVVFFPTSGAKTYANRVSEILIDQFEAGEALWYADQSSLYRALVELSDRVRVSDLKQEFRDFEFFSSTSVIWSAKGERKEFGEPFVSLSKLFGSSEFARVQAKHVIRRAGRLAASGKIDRFYKSHPDLVRRLPRSGTIYLPRIDLPWKPYKGSNPPLVSDDTLNIRLSWKRFVSHLALRFERQGVRMEIQEIPAWEITPEQVNSSSGDFALIAHKCDFQLKGLDLPVSFFMQEYMPWLFTIDARGWGAGASVYPPSWEGIDPSTIEAGTGAFDHYKAQFDRRLLATKFPQPPQRNIDQSHTPGYDLFIPLQIPHDQVIKFFSHVTLAEMIENAVVFARSKNLRLVMKPHPANLKSSESFKSFVDNKNIFWSEANIHDLIEQSHAIFTINSSVGFEAMLHDKPVVTFGRVLYDVATIRGCLDDLDWTWDQCRIWKANGGAVRYRAFYEWFCNHYAVDLSRPTQRDRSLDRHVQQLLSRVYAA